MTIELNHTIVPARDKEESARFYERMFGFEYQPPLGHFAPIKIPSQSLSLDFDTRESFQPQHYAFKVSEAEFDEIFGRIVEAGLVYGSDASGGIVVHRLMRVERQAGQLRFVTKGDASPRYDPPIEPSCVLGEVILARYRRLSLRVDNRIWRRLGWLLSSAAPFIHRIRRRMSS